MQDRGDLAEVFMALHHGDGPLVMANVWDPGSARLLASLGFAALASTSSGHAAALGRLDYGVSRDEAVSHAGELCAAVDLPVSADLEDCFPRDPGGVAETIRRAATAGLAGCSIEDWDQTEGALLSIERAAELVAVAAEQANSPGARLVLTARAENHIRENPDIEDTVARLLAYQDAGADVLYAPGVERPQDIETIVKSVERPVNVLIRSGSPPLSELSELGVARVSVGGAFAFLAYGSLARAAEALLSEGSYDFLAGAADGAQAVRLAFGD
jgi:2-methylisocitrate lyase-like PEP mutase family enzyme